MADVRPFISYAREDAAIAQRLYDDIVASGGVPWLDLQCLLPGQDWVEAVRTAIRDSSHFIAVISTRSVNKRGYVQKELRQALDIRGEFPPGASFLIPVRIDETAPLHEELLRLQWLDLYPAYDQALPLLMKALGLSPPSPSNRAPQLTLAAHREMADRQAFEQAISAGGSQQEIAERLGISRSAFYELLKRYRVL